MLHTQHCEGAVAVVAVATVAVVEINYLVKFSCIKLHLVVLLFELSPSTISNMFCNYIASNPRLE